MYSKKLIEDRNHLITRYEEVLNAGKTEERALTEEELAILNDIKAKVDSIEATIKADDDLTEMETMEVTEEPTEEEEKVEETRNIEEMERRSFEAYLRGEVNERNGELTPASGSAGAIVPTTIADEIIKKVYDICPVLDKSQKFNVKGKLDIPYYPYDSANITVAYATEFSALTSSSGKFASVELGGFLAGALTKVSRKLINNTNFDIVAFVIDEMAYQIARFIEGELLNGTDSKVEGLSGLTNGITTASASAITSDEIIELHDAIKDAYQQDAIWIMSSSTRTALRQLKTQQGVYLLNDDISTPFGVSILGKPVYVSDNMDDIGAGKVVVYYGDMKGLATKFSEEINVEVLRERFADEHAVGVIGWLEFDSKVVNEQAIAKLTMKSA
ncbi:phage major capsid protein [Sharpea azabuensis]|uniref:phage major capsid protein n=1 Tax=Sharpea azabuensis TaxID=322505 RepID=UPI002E821864|nr:phage major capsid protein [Sharpea azabuensis]MEE3307838.1 phage major capsid protein [Sharpea azabuensis]